MHCTYCGAQLADGKGFCSNCGKAKASSQVGMVAQPTPGGVAAVAPVAASSLQPNVAGLLCYIAGFVSGIFFLFADPYKRDPFVRFHAFQSIFVSIAWIVVHFAMGMLMSLLPWTMWHFAALLSSLFSLAFFILFLFLMYQAYSNERFKVPVIGDLAERQS